MKTMKTNQNGFSLGVILLALLVIGAVVLIGRFIYYSNKPPIHKKVNSMVNTPEKAASVAKLQAEKIKTARWHSVERRKTTNVVFQTQILQGIV